MDIDVQKLWWDDQGFESLKIRCLIEKQYEVNFILERRTIKDYIADNSDWRTAAEAKMKMLITPDNSFRNALIEKLKGIDIKQAERIVDIQITPEDFKCKDYRHSKEEALEEPN